MFAVIHYDPEYIRLGDDNEDVSGWLVDFVGTESGARDFIAEVIGDGGSTFEYFLLEQK